MDHQHDALMALADAAERREEDKRATDALLTVRGGAQRMRQTIARQGAEIRRLNEQLSYWRSCATRDRRDAKARSDAMLMRAQYFLPDANLEDIKAGVQADVDLALMDRGPGGLVKVNWLQRIRNLTNELHQQRPFPFGKGTFDWDGGEYTGEWRGSYVGFVDDTRRYEMQPHGAGFQVKDGVVYTGRWHDGIFLEGEIRQPGGGTVIKKRRVV